MNFEKVKVESVPDYVQIEDDIFKIIVNKDSSLKYKILGFEKIEDFVLHNIETNEIFMGFKSYTQNYRLKDRIYLKRIPALGHKVVLYDQFNYDEYIKIFNKYDINYEVKTNYQRQFLTDERKRFKKDACYISNLNFQNFGRFQGNCGYGYVIYKTLQKEGFYSRLITEQDHHDSNAEIFIELERLNRETLTKWESCVTDYNRREEAIINILIDFEDNYELM